MATSPTSSLTLPRPLSWPESTRTPSRTILRKPCLEISTLYLPTESEFKRKRPALSDLDVAVSPVSLLVALTSVSVTTDPWESTTTPEMEPFVICERLKRGIAREIKIAAQMPKHTRSLLLKTIQP